MIDRRALFTILAGGAATPLVKLMPVPPSDGRIAAMFADMAASIGRKTLEFDRDMAAITERIAREATASGVDAVRRQFPDMLEGAKSRFG